MPRRLAVNQRLGVERKYPVMQNLKGDPTERRRIASPTIS
jgi:hypothetical protein